MNIFFICRLSHQIVFSLIYMIFSTFVSCPPLFKCFSPVPETGIYAVNGSVFTNGSVEGRWDSVLG